MKQSSPIIIGLQTCVSLSTAGNRICSYDNSIPYNSILQPLTDPSLERRGTFHLINWIYHIVECQMESDLLNFNYNSGFTLKGCFPRGEIVVMFIVSTSSSSSNWMNKNISDWHKKLFPPPHIKSETGSDCGNGNWIWNTHKGCDCERKTKGGPAGWQFRTYRQKKRLKRIFWINKGLLFIIIIYFFHFQFFYLFEFDYDKYVAWAVWLSQLNWTDYILSWAWEWVWRDELKCF